MTQPRSVIVIGGGASGVLLCAQLLRFGGARLRVTLIEKREEAGRGLAFAAPPDHLLNVVAANMSAFAEAPDDFRDWLHERHPELGDDPWLFAPRQLYGSYLGERLRQLGAGDARLAVIRGEAVAVQPGESGVTVGLADGTQLRADAAVLAVGHEERPARRGGVAVRAGSAADTPLDPAADVLILGSGLSMIDAWLLLAARRHQGRIRIVSRHGLLPLPHARVVPAVLAAEDVPFGAGPRQVLRWLRRLATAAMAAGGDWRSVVDGLRPYHQRLWQSWTLARRAQFLRHVRPLWNVHRHRVPAVQAARLQQAIENGQVEIRAAAVLAIEAAGAGARVLLRARGKQTVEALTVDRVYDCGGLAADLAASTNPALRSLLDAGAARPDALRLGLEVTPELRVVDAAGRAAARLHAIGPLTRGQFFEIEAVPDIRRQCAELAAQLVR
jgi:uncharacterized NAD(P)/FAD-binding protein YdhS